MKGGEMIRIVCSRITAISRHIPRRACSLQTDETASTAGGKAKVGPQEEEEPWKDPYKQVLPEQTSTYSDYREAKVDWNYVRRLLPQKIIPEVKEQSAGEEISPSGWRAPKDPPADLPYYIRRGTNNMPEIYLERRRDELNPKTMDFEYVELVNLRNIHGDVFACERDMRTYLEARLGHPVATHVDELKGLIKVKGADRTLVEQFFYDYESGFTLCPVESSHSTF